MVKLPLLAALGFLFGAPAFAQDESAALGFGILSDSSEHRAVGGGIRGTIFLDAGTKLYGPFHYGFEFQGDVKRLDQTSSSLSKTDVAAFYYGSSAASFLQQTDWKITYRLWDVDLSPRGYISFDLGTKLQLLSFLGLNYNWQTLDFDARSNDSNYADVHRSTDLGGCWDVLAGFRVSVGAFYLDYTRILRPDDDGNSRFGKYNKNRFGLGINLRF